MTYLSNGPTLAPSDSTGTPNGTSAPWDSDAARDNLRACALWHIADAAAVLVLGECDFRKPGSRFVGAQRCYDLALGRAEHRQVGLFLGCISPRGQGVLDRELFLPRVWAERESLRRSSGVPADVIYTTKPQIGRRMLARALDAGAPHGWVVAPATFGADAGLRHWLEASGEAYVVGINGRETVSIGGLDYHVGPLAAAWPSEAWRRVGDRHWAWVRIACEHKPGWQRWLMVSQVQDGTHQHFIGFARKHVLPTTMAQVAYAHSDMIATLEDAKREVGLENYESRSWMGWYRHMTVSLMAHAVLGHRGRSAAAACGERRCQPGASAGVPAWGFGS